MVADRHTGHDGELITYLAASRGRAEILAATSGGETGAEFDLEVQVV